MYYLPVLKFLQLILYFFIASQGAFYLIGFYKILMGIPERDFILLRKAADPVLAPHLKILYVLALIISLLVIILQLSGQRSVLLIFSIIAFVLFMADTIIALRVSEPLNKVIQVLQEPFTDAAPIRIKWLWQIYLRAFLSVGSFVSLLIGYTGFRF